MSLSHKLLVITGSQAEHRKFGAQVACDIIGQFKDIEDLTRIICEDAVVTLHQSDQFCLAHFDSGDFERPPYTPLHHALILSVMPTVVLDLYCLPQSVMNDKTGLIVAMHNAGSTNAYLRQQELMKEAITSARQSQPEVYGRSEDPVLRNIPAALDSAAFRRLVFKGVRFPVDKEALEERLIGEIQKIRDLFPQWPLKGEQEAAVWSPFIKQMVSDWPNRWALDDRMLFPTGQEPYSYDNSELATPIPAVDSAFNYYRLVALHTGAAQVKAISHFVLDIVYKSLDKFHSVCK